MSNNKNTKKHHYLRRLSLGGVVTLGLVTIIGSGGGGGDGGGGGTGTASNITLNGSAAKGIINKGSVIAEELDSSGIAIRQVGSATTGANGGYEIDVDSSYEGGPIQITISATADTETKCDIAAGCGTRSDGIADTNTSIDFGEWYKPSSLSMTALVAEAAANDKINVNVTPYTDLAARHAKEGGTLDASAVYNANSEVSNLLGGIDILNTKPLDITDAAVVADSTPTEMAYASLAAAIAASADMSQGNPDLNGALQTLANSFTGGKMAADDTASANDDQMFSLQELIDAANSTFSQTGMLDTSGVLAGLQDSVNNASDTDGDNIPDIDPAPSTTASSPALTKVKAFVSDLRTWGNVIEAEMDTQGSAFDDQISLADEASSLALDFLIGPALEATLEAIGQNIDGTHGDGALSGYGLGFTSGTISSNNGIYTITNAVIEGVTVNMSASIPEHGSAAPQTSPLASLRPPSAAP